MAVAITVPDTEAAPVAEPAARVSAAKMFRYSEFVDVGEGAAECEHARDGQCIDAGHFHAWCRLPNPYQHADIRAKGLAAKARRIRALKDPESDEATVLTQALAQLDDAAFTGAIVEELLGRDWAEDYFEAARVVKEDETFAHLEQDREEYGRLASEQTSLPESGRSPEFTALSEHLERYATAVRDHLAEIQSPKREELAARPLAELLDLLRQRRVEEDADREFMAVYNAWMCFVGTFAVELHPTLGRPHRPMWEQIGSRDRAAAGTMFAEAPEVIDALDATYTSLQVALQKGSAGN